MNNLIIRQAFSSDIADITQLFYDTIQTINAKDYSQDELDDWSSSHTDKEKWLKKIKEQHFIVVFFCNKIIGFSSITTDGYLDFMFVHKDFQRKGVAGKLLKIIEIKAIKQGNKLISSDVSVTARSLFESFGFVVKEQQLKKSKEKELINFKMIKKLE